MHAELAPRMTMRDFAGNAIELHNKGEQKLLVLSSRAGRALPRNNAKD